MTNVLLLVHRIPYPPNKGDKIRSYHLLRHLAQRHRVFLGAFVDDPFDRQYEGAVSPLCVDQFLAPMNPRARKLASLRGLLTGEALSLPYYRVAAMQRWVDDTIARQRIEAVVVFSSTMAQFVEGDRHRGLTRIVDFVDVDSDKWLQYAARGRGPKAWVYAREGRLLLSYERRVAADFDASLFVTEAEAALFRRLAPEVAEKVGYFENGVDTEYFDPSQPFEDPYPAGRPVLVFTGAMDYWPNVEAVTWFADEVLPRIRLARPDVRLAVVGSNPTETVRALGNREGITVTGRVPDVRPYLRHAAVAVAPLRIARGIQNKVLEALAMARPVVCTPPAAEGLRPSPLMEAATADTPEAVALLVLENLGRGEVPGHRAYVVEHYGWDANLAVVDRLLEPRAAPARPAAAAVPA
jgi:sugar transferase (PEP-CTERM/EpsH1 system associated)